MKHFASFAFVAVVGLGLAFGPGGMPAHHGMTGAEYGQMISGMATGTPGAVGEMMRMMRFMH